MKSKSVVFFLTLVIALSSLFFGYSSPVNAKTWTLKLSIEVPEMAPLCAQGFKPWAKEVEKATNGRVKVVIYPSGTLCRVGDMLDAVQSGIADLGWCWPGLHEGFAPLSMVSNLPMVFETAESGSKAVWDLYENNTHIQDEYKDFKLVSFWATDAYFFMSRKKPIHTISDLKGMKIRAANATTVDFLKKLKATPVMMRMPDVYMGLQKGTLDGTLAQGEAIQGFKFYEVIKYYTKPGMMPGSHIMIMNKKVWNSMPPDVQQQFMSVSGGTLAAKIGRNVFDIATEGFPAKATKEGAKYEIIQLPPDEVDKFRQTAAVPVQKEWSESLEKKGLPARQILYEFKQLVKQYDGNK
ncbi:TRAP transporter substrate-binding protein [Thermodesulfobacteriota bacterium]